MVNHHEGSARGDQEGWSRTHTMSMVCDELPRGSEDRLPLAGQEPSRGPRSSSPVWRRLAGLDLVGLLAEITVIVVLGRQVTGPWEA